MICEMLIPSCPWCCLVLTTFSCEQRVEAECSKSSTVTFIFNSPKVLRILCRYTHTLSTTSPKRAHCLWQLVHDLVHQQKMSTETTTTTENKKNLRISPPWCRSSTLRQRQAWLTSESETFGHQKQQQPQKTNSCRVFPRSSVVCLWVRLGSHVRRARQRAFLQHPWPFFVQEWRPQVGQTGRSANTCVVGEDVLRVKPRSQRCVRRDPPAVSPPSQQAAH